MGDPPPQPQKKPTLVMFQLLLFMPLSLWYFVMDFQETNTMCVCVCGAHTHACAFMCIYAHIFQKPTEFWCQANIVWFIFFFKLFLKSTRTITRIIFGQLLSHPTSPYSKGQSLFQDNKLTTVIKAENDRNSV